MNKNKRVDARFVYFKGTRMMIQPALGAWDGTKEEIRQQVEEYCKQNNYTLLHIEGVMERKQRSNV